VIETAFFADHHPYTAQDVDRIAARAANMRLGVVTTQKDAVRLGAVWREAKHGPLIVLPVELRLDQPDYLTAMIAASCGAAS
jgi:tetraacyldisaccharide-1-P 4'-kinase